jgi:hypothetical protein
LCIGDTCIRTSCNHVFHKECMDIWMNRKLECPLCRQKVQKHCLCITDCTTSVPSGIVSQEATFQAIRDSACGLPNHHTGSWRSVTCHPSGIPLTSPDRSAPTDISAPTDSSSCGARARAARYLINNMF